MSSISPTRFSRTGSASDRSDAAQPRIDSSHDRRHGLGDLVACYIQAEGRTSPQLLLLPQGRITDLVEPRLHVPPDLPEIRNRPKWMNPVRGSIPDCLIHYKLREDDQGWGYSAGISMQQNPAMDRLVLQEQNVSRGVDETVIETTLLDPRHGLQFTHRLRHLNGSSGVEAEVTCINLGPTAVHLELLTSFVLSGISPFHYADCPNGLRLHRFRSWWSAEAKKCSESMEELHLGRSWSATGHFCEKFGQVGTMPVRKWFPFAAVEDIEAGVTWGAQIAWPGSWQIEVARKGDRVSVSGGLADREFGHWIKRLEPGETVGSPKAILTVVNGGLAEVGQALVRTQELLLPPPPAVEAALPVVFNEWCSSWGSPTHDKIISVARKLVGSGVKYIVIDDGWMQAPEPMRGLPDGDWLVDETKFPDGFANTCRELRALGFVPGVWFEFEVVGAGSHLRESHATHLLQKDGRPLRSGGRFFWDLNDSEARMHLENRMIRLLREANFGYLKVDYNDNLGIGCDHPDSLGEGLRNHVLGITAFFQRLRQALPDLVIENCSSGGHRLEPVMMSLTSMSSFSDAHESLSIPIIARNLHYLIPPRQSQIWAVLHPSDSLERLVYSLSSTFLGRMCLSGPVELLSENQMKVVQQAVSLYELAAPVIMEGISEFIEEAPENYNYPKGFQGLFRMNHNLQTALVVVHGFDLPAPTPFQVPLPVGSWSLLGCLLDEDTSFSLNTDIITITCRAGFHGAVVVLRRE